MHNKVIKKRLLSVIPTLIGVSLLLFLLLKLTPGDPVDIIVGPRASEEVIEKYRAKLHLDKPFFVQYVFYMKTLLKGDFGRSYFTNENVFDALIQKLPNTLLLAVLSMLIGTLLGLVLGIMASLKRGSLLDKALSSTAIIFISTPVFWTAIMLVLVFSVLLDWTPASTIGEQGFIAFLLPAFVLGSRSAGYIARLTRSSMLDALSSEYIQTARVKGLSMWRVTIHHAFRNCLIPVVTLVGIDFGSYLNGSVLTENIFGIDGIGRYAITAILKRDIPVIMGTVIMGAFIFIIVNLMVDLLYFKLDPRVSEGLQQEAL
ncbi:MAG: ABC transporter permease [Candidatus Aureabacteria bacterium]|nr:ABC transporter permease [Candidatus Auribacterota bacterium]